MIRYGLHSLKVLPACAGMIPLKLFLIAFIATTLGELAAEVIRKQAPRLKRWLRSKRR